MVRADVPSVRSTAWKVYLGAVALVAVVYFLLPNSPLSKLLLYNGAGLSAVVAMVLGIWRNSPQRRRPWILITLGQVSFLAADVVYYILEAVTHSTPFPSVADVLYLAMYPFLISGLLGLFRQVSPGRDVASVIDAALVGVATFAVLWILVMDSYATDPTMRLTDQVISMAYPVMDVAVLTVAVRLVAWIQLRNPSYALLAGGVTSLLAADVIYGILNSAGLFETGGVADAFWLGFYALLAAAALHPAMAATVPPRPAVTGRLTAGRVGVLFLVTLTVPVCDLVWGEPVDKWVTTVASMSMFGLVLLRLMGLVGTIQTRERRAQHDALHDPLTGLANRVLFAQRVQETLARPDQTVAVLFVDLDEFKAVNDNLGHRAGDVLLERVAQRLLGCVRGDDTVARLGGDEFAILLVNIVDRRDAVVTAQRLLDRLSDPIHIADREILICASIGITVDRCGAATLDSLLQRADAAMYSAKERGKARYEVFDEVQHSTGVDKLELRRDLQAAIDRGEFEIHYQPIFDVSTGAVTKAEALLRWNHPTRGLVMPDDFIEFAEQTGLIIPIGHWVLNEASAQIHQWNRAYGLRIGVAVNLSVRQLHHPGLLEDVAEALLVSGLDPELLTLELTESMLLQDTERGARVLEHLKALKVKLAIDDFGKGYSSLVYLSQFPFEILKIDRTFLQELATSPTAEALVRTVITLAQSLNITTVAEGIEDPDQLRVLRRLKCQLGQGFHFSRPLNVSDMATFLQTSALQASPEQPSNGILLPRPRAGGGGQLDAEIHDGQEALWDLWSALDDLHDAAGVPIMARTSWMDVWADVYTEWTPRAIIIREPGHGRIDGAALLAWRTTDQGVEIVGMGHGSAACTVFPVRSPHAVQPLARAMAAQMTDAPGPARLHLQQLLDHDRVVPALSVLLAGAELRPELPVPKVVLRPGDCLDSLLSTNLRRQLQKAYNRLKSDAIAVEITFHASTVALEQRLDQLVQIHRRRDHDMGRPSSLDDPITRRFWRELLIRHGRQGHVEVALLRLNTELAGYVVSLRDRGSYRVVDGYFDTRFSRYSPGRVIETAVLERAAGDPNLRELDWMSGIAPEKILFSNAAEPRQRLIATNSTGYHVSRARQLEAS